MFNPKQSRNNKSGGSLVSSSFKFIAEVQSQSLTEALDVTISQAQGDFVKGRQSLDRKKF
jgi:hypothetical protein